MGLPVGTCRLPSRYLPCASPMPLIAVIVKTSDKMLPSIFHQNFIAFLLYISFLGFVYICHRLNEYTCKYICVYVCVYVYICVYVCVYVYIYVPYPLYTLSIYKPYIYIQICVFAPFFGCHYHQLGFERLDDGKSLYQGAARPPTGPLRGTGLCTLTVHTVGPFAVKGPVKWWKGPVK